MPIANAAIEQRSVVILPADSGGSDRLVVRITIGFDDDYPRMLLVTSVNHEPAFDDVGLEPSGLLQHSAELDLGTPRCSIRNSAWLVNERSQLHHKVGMDAFDGSLVALRHGVQECR
jgi:hypothetical protein